MLQGFGYTPERLAEGLALWNQTQALSQRQTREYGESFGATEALDSAWTTAHTAYVRTLKVARVAFGDEPLAAASLKLYGPRRESLAGWLDQASTFYANLTPLVGRLAKYGYTAAKVASEAALVETVRQAQQNQVKESGEAQQATVDRDRSVEALDMWVSELRAIAKVAFADEPQHLEKLGIAVLNAPRAKKAVRV